jgi:hypothetical protein
MARPVEPWVTGRPQMPSLQATETTRAIHSPQRQRVSLPARTGHGDRTLCHPNVHKTFAPRRSLRRPKDRAPNSAGASIPNPPQLPSAEFRDVAPATQQKHEGSQAMRPVQDLRRARRKQKLQVRRLARSPKQSDFQGLQTTIGGVSRALVDLRPKGHRGNHPEESRDNSVANYRHVTERSPPRRPRGLVVRTFPAT